MGHSLLNNTASLGFGPALVKLGQISFACGCFKAAFEYFKAASHANMGEGTHVLAGMYRDRMVGIQQDMQRAEELCRKAIQEGHYEACNNLTVILSNKANCPSDPNVLEALEAWEQSLKINLTSCFFPLLTSFWVSMQVCHCQEWIQKCGNG